MGERAFVSRGRALLSSTSVSATRLGPSRFTSTAPSSGASKLTAAAEWMTMSQLASSPAAGVVEAEPVSSDVAGDGREPPVDLVSKLRAELRPQAVEAVVAQDLASGALGRRLALARADEHDDLAFGHAAQQSLDERGAEKAGRPGDGNPLPGEIVGYHGCVSSIRVPKRLANSAARAAPRRWATNWWPPGWRR